MIHDAEPHGTETLKSSRSSSARRTSARTDRRALPRRERPEEVDGALRVRAAGRDRLPRREPRHPAVVLVGVDDRHRPDRAGRLGHGDPARLGLRRDRERRRVDPAAPRRPRRRAGRRRGRSAADPRARRRLPAAHDAARRRLGPGDGRARRRFPATAVAGKTGTAQKPGPNGYIPGAYVATFVGMVPASRPRLARARDHRRAARARSTAASSRRPRSSRSRPSTSSTSRFRPTCGSVGDPSRVDSRPRWTWSASSQRSSRWRCSGALRSRCAISPTTRARSRPARSSSPCRARVPTATTSRRRRSSAGRSRSSSSARSTCRVPQVVVRDARAAMAPAADVFFGEPTRELEVVGVTGTSGKTTTSFLLFAILAAAGRRPGLLGTVEARVGGERRGVVRTTPEAIDLQRRVPRDARRRRPLVRDGGVVARVRPPPARPRPLRRAGLHEPQPGPPGLPRRHGVVLRGQAAALPRRAAADRGRQRRRRVRTAAGAGAARRRSRSRRPTRARSTASNCGSGGASTSRTRSARCTRRGRSASATTRSGEGLESVRGVPGRFESVDAGQPFHVIVDYAHKPDALEKVLRAARDLADGNRVICVVGAGGDRDRGKRGGHGTARVRARRRRDRHLRQPAQRGSRGDRRGDRRRGRRRRSRSSSTGPRRSGARSSSRSRATSSSSPARGPSRARSSPTARCRSTTARRRRTRCGGARPDPAAARRGAGALAGQGRGRRGRRSPASTSTRAGSGRATCSSPSRGGEAFLDDARARGAAATLVPDDAHAALAALGSAVRARSDARVVAITGSVGKTSTKDILAALLRTRSRTVAAPDGFNNEVGLPLTLCRDRGGHRGRRDGDGDARRRARFATSPGSRDPISA